MQKLLQKFSLIFFCSKILIIEYLEGEDYGISETKQENNNRFNIGIICLNVFISYFDCYAGKIIHYCLHSDYLYLLEKRYCR